MELLAYLAIISIVVVLLTGTMTFAIRSYDKVSGQGALNSQANFIMSNLMTQANAFNPEYIESCSDVKNCFDLVVEKEWKIDFDTGLLVEQPVDKRIRIRIDENTKSIYIGDMKLNSDNYAVEFFEIDANGDYVLDAHGDKIPYDYINFDCNDPNYIGICQKFVLKIRLAIYKINAEGKKVSKTIVYENRFSF
ncbi:hypothetical protein KHQ81_05625 [Mycoplasmatota bacterium]|nr:hypothetical protein KHQ81_05625 [Mycoplasmatota bacterium]